MLRAIARLFTCKWVRSGEEGRYRYELTQDLRERLAEQDMRNRDLHAALMALDEKMNAYRALAGATPAQMRERLSKAAGAERDMLRKASGPNWGGFQHYFRLTPAELAALGSGQNLEFRSNESRPDRRLPDEWRGTMLGSFGDQALAWSDEHNNLIGGPYAFLKEQGHNPTRIVDWPGAWTMVTLKVDRSELGQVSLHSEAGYMTPYKDNTTGMAVPEVLATAQSPSVAKPDNAAANKAQRAQPPFTDSVSLRPEPSCPVHKAAAAERRQGKPETPPPGPPKDGIMDVQAFQNLERDLRLGKPHVNTADVWEAVHDASRMPVVADFYTRLYPQERLTVEKATLFDALNQVSDEMRVRWRKDGAFLLGRSTSFFWDKLKEVPNRQLERWQADKRASGLPVADVLEMALQPDEQLDSSTVGDGVGHCWGLEEWLLLGSVPGGYSPRPWLRFVAAMPEAKRNQAFGDQGLPLETLTALEAQTFFTLMGGRLVGSPTEVQRFLVGRRLRVDFAPEGWFAWVPIVSPVRSQDSARNLPSTAAPTHAKAFALARRIDPNCGLKRSSAHGASST